MIHPANVAPPARVRCQFTHGGTRHIFDGVALPTEHVHDLVYVALQCTEHRHWGTLHATPHGRWLIWLEPGEVTYLDGGPMSIDEVRLWE